jgi:hypothetical protein
MKQWSPPSLSKPVKGCVPEGTNIAFPVTPCSLINFLRYPKKLFGGIPSPLVSKVGVIDSEKISALVRIEYQSPSPYVSSAILSLICNSFYSAVRAKYISVPSSPAFLVPSTRVIEASIASAILFIFFSNNIVN